MMGDRNSSSADTGVMWQQQAAGMLYGSASQQPQLVAKAGAVRLPGAIALNLKP
jgi:hypothetical protein